MKRSGFTMIELIFVIVILGILAAVAIPKLAATRDDAKIAKAATEVSTAIQDFGAYYTAQGQFGTVDQMTNVVLAGNTDSLNVLNPNSTTDVTYQVSTASGTEDCITLTLTGDGNVTATNSTPTGSSVCQGMKNALTANDVLDNTNSYGGSSVTW